MEACGSAHHWARVISRYGHEVRLLPSAYEKPYVQRNKNHGLDAEGICEAVTRPTMRFVAVKSYRAAGGTGRSRNGTLLVRRPTMGGNALRAALSEFGIVAAQGYEGLRKLMARLEVPSERIPDMIRAVLLVLAKHWQALDAGERVRVIKV